MLTNVRAITYTLCLIIGSGNSVAHVEIFFCITAKSDKTILQQKYLSYLVIKILRLNKTNIIIKKMPYQSGSHATNSKKQLDVRDTSFQHKWYNESNLHQRNCYENAIVNVCCISLFILYYKTLQTLKTMNLFSMRKMFNENLLIFLYQYL